MEKWQDKALLEIKKKMRIVDGTETSYLLKSLQRLVQAEAMQ